MKSNTNKFTTKTLVLIGLFSAICFVTLYFKIPIPAPVGNPFLHMGNMFVILASLLFSGTIGGLAGSIGMGLFDALNGYMSSVFKTLILKFGIGIITGLVASRGHKEGAKSPIKWLGTAAALFIIAGIALCSVSITYGNEITIPGIEKSFIVIPALYIASLTLGLSLSIICFMIRRIDIKLQYAILGGVAGITFNLIGEFLFGLGTLLLAGSGFMPAVISAAISLPATLINGVFSVVVAIILYMPLSKLVLKLRW